MSDRVTHSEVHIRDQVHGFYANIPEDEELSPIFKGGIADWEPAIACFFTLGWATKLTYEGTQPLPDRFVTKAGRVVMTSADVIVGKAGFQKADLFDCGSLYGMDSYFGSDYTADNLVRIAELTKENIAQAR